MTKFHSERGELENVISQTRAAVVGTLDSALRIDRISGEAHALMGQHPHDLIGESILALVAEADVPTFLNAYAEAATTQCGVTVALHLSCEGSGDRARAVLCDVFVVPLQPAPGCAFVLRPIASAANVSSPDGASAETSFEPENDGRRPAPGLLRGVPVREIPGASRLTARESQIVSRLLDGHRPPGIARALFLSQSTVRNHLASVFRKLGVTSQEGLLELFRVDAAADGDDPEAVDHGQMTRTS
jgi:DNA-binding CsgD family transcriptional regulator